MSLFDDIKGRARLMFSLESRDDSEAEEQKQVDRLEELSEYCPQLTFQQRLLGFAASFSLGCKSIFCNSIPLLVQKFLLLFVSCF